MSKIHQSYEILFSHECDFKVEYEFYSPDEGGRENLPHQGIRSDFWYECDNHENPDNLYMIYPEYENNNGELIPSGPVLRNGTARMWILNPKWRKYHQERIKINTIGYFHEGSKRTGVCKVVEIIGLNENPTE